MGSPGAAQKSTEKPPIEINGVYFCPAKDINKYIEAMKKEGYIYSLISRFEEGQQKKYYVFFKRENKENNKEKVENAISKFFSITPVKPEETKPKKEEPRKKEEEIGQIPLAPLVPQTTAKKEEKKSAKEEKPLKKEEVKKEEAKPKEEKKPAKEEPPKKEEAKPAEQKEETKPAEEKSKPLEKKKKEEAKTVEEESKPEEPSGRMKIESKPPTSEINLAEIATLDTKEIDKQSRIGGKIEPAPIELKIEEGGEEGKSSTGSIIGKSGTPFIKIEYVTKKEDKKEGKKEDKKEEKKEIIPQISFGTSLTITDKSGISNTTTDNFDKHPAENILPIPFTIIKKEGEKEVEETKILLYIGLSKRFIYLYAGKELKDNKGTYKTLNEEGINFIRATLEKNKTKLKLTNDPIIKQIIKAQLEKNKTQLKLTDDLIAQIIIEQIINAIKNIKIRQ